MIIAEGRLTTLRETTPSDVQLLNQWAQDPEIRSLDPPTLIFGAQVRLAIEADGKLIGMCCLYNYTPTTVEMGIRIGDKNYWNRGYGTDAVTLLTDYAFKTTKAQFVLAKAVVGNDRARACYRKCGYVEYSYTAIASLNYVLMHKGKG